MNNEDGQGVHVRLDSLAKNVSNEILSDKVPSKTKNFMMQCLLGDFLLMGGSIASDSCKDKFQCKLMLSHLNTYLVDLIKI